MAERKRIEVKLDQYKPLREIVFEALRQAILQEIIKPGERLMEKQLGEEMGVSRTPIREAIRRLELEGFVTIVPRKGAFVSEISLKDIKEVYEIRAALESLAAGLAAEKVTPQEIQEMQRCLQKEAELLENDDVVSTVEVDLDLHYIIFKAANNERLLATLNNLREQLSRPRMIVTSLPGRKVASHWDHVKIVEAISSGNIELSEQLIWDHIEYSANTMIDYYKQKYE